MFYSQKNGLKYKSIIIMGLIIMYITTKCIFKKIKTISYNFLSVKT